jgi:hypothetical protein
MTKAKQSHPDVFTCNCGGFMFAGCGVVNGQSLNEELLMCSECDHEELVLAEEVEIAKENYDS